MLTLVIMTAEDWASTERRMLCLPPELVPSKLLCSTECRPDNVRSAETQLTTVEITAARYRIIKGHHCQHNWNNATCPRVDVECLYLPPVSKAIVTNTPPAHTPVRV